MTNLTRKRRILLPYALRVGLALLCVLGALALAACLPLQVGFERPTALSTLATQVALVTPTSAPLTATVTETRATPPAPTDATTRTPSPTAPATAATLQPATPAATSSAKATPTPRAVATAIECALTHTVAQGERLTQIGALYGVPWQEIASLNGLANPGLIFAGQVLCLPPNARLPNTPTRTPTPTATASVTPSVTSTPTSTTDLCLDAPPWFFTPTPPICPTAAAINSQAAAQRFEHGQMLWLAALDRYFVLVDGASASTRAMTYLPGPLDLKPGASVDNRVPETPQPGLEQPVSGFGLIWRGEVIGSENVRVALGWATQSEFAYATTHQCQASYTTEWNCYLRAPGGQVLRLYYTPNLGFFWDPVE